MSDAPSTSAAAKPKAKGKKKPAAAAAEEQAPPPPFKPAKLTFYDRQVVDYVRTATAKNVWYYRCAMAAAQGAMVRKERWCRARPTAWPTSGGDGGRLARGVPALASLAGLEGLTQGPTACAKRS